MMKMTGLKILQNRGYDSAGMGTIRNSNFMIRKVIQKLEALKDFKEVLLALSNDDLYINCKFKELHIFDISSAVFSACSLLSITQGPAINVNDLLLLITKSLTFTSIFL